MAEVLLFHHAQGLTDGVRAFADDLRAAGHVVHLPDLYDGATYATLDEGMAHVQEIGVHHLIERGREIATGLPARLVYAGISLGVLPAQALAHTHPGAAAAVLVSAAIPLAELGGLWPGHTALQVHVEEDDRLGDVPIARALAASVPGAELHLYPGAAHLFLDRSLPDHDPPAAEQATARILALLDRVDAAG